MDGSIRRLDPAMLVWPAAIAQLLLVVGITLTVLLPRDARISVQAQTDIASFLVNDGQNWLSWGTIEGVAATTAMDECAQASVEFRSDVIGPMNITLQTAPDGSLTAVLQNKKHALGNVTCADGRILDSTGYLVIVWPKDNAQRLVLPIAGSMTLGEDVSIGMSEQLILHEGRVTVEASSAPFRSGRVNRETPLFAGDRLFLAGEGDDVSVSSHALVQMDPSGRMNITAHANAAQALVVHFGQDKASAASLAPTFLEKIQAQSQWALLLLIGAILINVLKMVLEYVLERGAPPSPPAKKRRSRYYG